MNNLESNTNQLKDSIAHCILIGLMFSLCSLPMIFLLEYIYSDLVNVVSREASLKSMIIKLVHYSMLCIPASIPLYIFFSIFRKERSLGRLPDYLYLNVEYDRLQSLSWKPIANSGEKRNNKKWVLIKPGLYGIRDTYPYQAFIYPIVLAGLVHGYYSSAELKEFFFSGGFWVAVTAIFVGLCVRFARFSGFIINLNKKLVQVGNSIIPLSSVMAIQVLHKKQSHNHGGMLFDVYEANIIYSGNQRYNILNHGDLPELIYQLKKMHEFVSFDIIVDKQTYDALH